MSRVLEARRKVLIIITWTYLCSESCPISTPDMSFGPMQQDLTYSSNDYTADVPLCSYRTRDGLLRLQVLFPRFLGTASTGDSEASCEDLEQCCEEM